MEGKLLGEVDIQRMSFKVDCLHIILTCQQGKGLAMILCASRFSSLSLSLAELRQPVVSNLFIGFQVDYSHSTMSRRNNGAIVHVRRITELCSSFPAAVGSSIYIADHTARVDGDDDFPWGGCTATWYIGVHGKKDAGWRQDADNELCVFQGNVKLLLLEDEELEGLMYTHRREMMTEIKPAHTKTMVGILPPLPIKPLANG